MSRPTVIARTTTPPLHENGAACSGKAEYRPEIHSLESGFPGNMKKGIALVNKQILQVPIA